MKRLDVRYQKSAVDDLQDIFLFLREIGADANVARGYVARIREACNRIGDAPEGGRPRPDLADGLRTIAFERRAVIAYRMEGAFVLIERIFYGGRDIDARFAADHERPRDRS